MLLAAGGLLIESFVEGGRWRARILKPCIVTGLVAKTALMVPWFLPVMPPERLLAFQEFRGVPADEVELQQTLADRLCWEEFVAEVARVYEALPEEDRQRSVIFGGSYHTAGAIDFLGRKYGLPAARSNHNSYYLWGPGDTSWGVVIFAGLSEPRSRLEELFDEVVEAGRGSCEYNNSLESKGLGTKGPIWLCRGMKRPIADIWEGAKTFN